MSLVLQIQLIINPQLGWVFTLGRCTISWASKKQTCVTYSTMESEFIDLGAASKEVEWLRNLLLNIVLWPQPMLPISLHYDSQTTISRVLSKISDGKSRHISLRHEYIRQLITDGIINVIYVGSCKSPPAPFTKTLSQDLIRSTSTGMG